MHMLPVPRLAAQLPPRRRLRMFLEEIKVEATIMALVIVYAIFIFLDLLLAKPVRRSPLSKGHRWQMGVMGGMRVHLVGAESPPYPSCAGGRTERDQRRDRRDEDGVGAAEVDVGRNLRGGRHGLPLLLHH